MNPQVINPRVTVSMRYGEGETAPMVSFSGTPDQVAADLVVVFDLDEQTANQALGALIAHVAQTARATGLLVDQLGATPLPEARAALPTQRPAPHTPAPQARAAEPAPALEGIHPLYAEIKRHNDVAALRRLWAEHRAEFDAHPDLMTALNGHVKSLEAKTPAHA